MTYHDQPDPNLQPDDDAPYKSEMFTGFAVVIGTGAAITAGIWAAMHIIRWATT